MNLESLRRLFPVTQNSIYLNHSGTGPVSTRVQEAMAAEIDDVLNHGAAGLPKWYQLCQAFKKRFASFIGAQSEEIAITLNTSEGINIVAQGLDWKPGDNVVLPDKEYPANVYPWMNLASRGVEVRFVSEVEGAYPVESYQRLMDERTRVVATSHVQFSSGFRTDLAALGALCRKRGIYLVVDAIQSLGVVPVDVKAMKIDFLSTSTYKWMLGPQGVGLFYLDRRLLDAVQPTWVGSESVIDAKDYLSYDLTFDPTAKRFEPGTYSTVGVAGADAALALLQELGPEFIQQRIFECTDCIYEGVRAKGYRVYSPWKVEQRSGIISMLKDGEDPERTSQMLLEHNILTTVRDGRLRMAPHVYNTLEEIDRVIDLLP